MTAIISYTLNLLYRVLYSIRTTWSLRQLTLLLPAGAAAPRLELLHLPPSPVHTPTEKLRATDTCTSDENYTTTSGLTDFEDDNKRITLGNTLTSTPANDRSVKGLDSLERKRPTGCSEHSFSDNGIFPSSARIPWRHRPPVRGCSIERARAPVHSHGGSKLISHQSMDTLGCFKVSKTRGVKVFGNNSPVAVGLQGTVHKKTKRPVVPSRRARNLRHRSTSEDSVDCDLGVHPPDSQRIAQLESELSRLRSQLAHLIVLQEGKHLLVPSSEELEPRLEGDGESDVDPVGIGDAHVSHPAVVESEGSRDASPVVASAPLIINPNPVPPPPPPPLLPSPPSAPKDDWRTRLIEKKKQKYGISPASKIGPVVQQKPADMNQVLRELQSGSVKLRSVPRSPGGTPVRNQPIESNNEMDACAIIARALKKKFCRVRAVLDRSTSGGENSHGSSFQDSASDIKTFSNKDHHCNSPYESMKQNPPFGQHLLRPTQGPTATDISSSYH